MKSTIILSIKFMLFILLGFTLFFSSCDNDEEEVNPVLSTSRGSAKATINGKEVDVEWVQLWENGPKFAVYNVGVIDGKIESEGGHYCWGSSIDKDPDSNYKEGSEALTGEFDTATKLWGSNWRMPTEDELFKLYTKCSVKSETINDVEGALITGKDSYVSNTIFLPFADRYLGTKGENYGTGDYWSSTPKFINNKWEAAYSMWVAHSGSACLTNFQRPWGFMVRAVLNEGNENNVETLVITNSSCPDNKHPHAIDLGLPSGTKWCCMNVGASKPEDNGGYYAWGETSTKQVFDWTTYKHISGSHPSDCNDIGTNIEGTSYDVAHVQMGGRWKMPSVDQRDELMNKCLHKWAKMDNVFGILVSGKNGNSIFFPAAGYRYENNLLVEGIQGSYWTSTLSSISGVYYLEFDSFGWARGSSGPRCYGRTVRAVTD